MRSSAQGEFEGKALPLIGAVPDGAANYRSGGDRAKEPKAMKPAKRGQSPLWRAGANEVSAGDAQGIGGVRSSREAAGAPDSPVGRSPMRPRIKYGE
jgi:hypothetical protein